MHRRGRRFWPVEPREVMLAGWGGEDDGGPENRPGSWLGDRADGVVSGQVATSWVESARPWGLVLALLALAAVALVVGLGALAHARRRRQPSER